MRVRSLDSSGDWNYGRGINDYKTGNLAVAQNIQTRVSSFLKDCFFALGDGIDWWNLLGAKNQLALEFSVRAQILNTKEVTGILQLEAELDADRDFAMRYNVQTAYSTSLVGDYSYSLGTIG